MLTALVLICSIAVTPDLADCVVKNAAIVMRVPGEFVHPAIFASCEPKPFWLRLPSVKT